MLTDPVEILKSIVEHDGDCEGWAQPAICKRCPLGNKKKDGRKVNCMDFLNLSNEKLNELTEEEVLEIYKKAAEEEIFSIEFEKSLE